MNKINWPATAAKFVVGLPFILAMSCIFAIVSIFDDDGNKMLNSMWSPVEREY